MKQPTQKTIHGRELKVAINAYLLSAVDCSGYTVLGTDTAGALVNLPVICETDQAKVNFIMSTFEHEYLHQNNRKGNIVDIFSEWLQGLPSCFNIDFENYRILEIAQEWGTLAPDATNSKKDRILDNWFNYISNKFFQLHKSLNR